MKRKLSKSKKKRLRLESAKDRAWQARNVLLTADRDWGQLAEDAVLNPRRHKTIQKMAKKKSLPQVKRIIIRDKQLDNGIS